MIRISFRWFIESTFSPSLPVAFVFHFAQSCIGLKYHFFRFDISNNSSCIFSICLFFCEQSMKFFSDICHSSLQVNLRANFFSTKCVNNLQKQPLNQLVYGCSSLSDSIDLWGHEIPKFDHTKSTSIPNWHMLSL